MNFLLKEDYAKTVDGGGGQFENLHMIQSFKAPSEYTGIDFTTRRLCHGRIRRGVSHQSVMFATPRPLPSSTPQVLVKPVTEATEELIKFSNRFESQGRQINYFSLLQTEVAPFSQHDRATVVGRVWKSMKVGEKQTCLFGFWTAPTNNQRDLSPSKKKGLVLLHFM